MLNTFDQIQLSFLRVVLAQNQVHEWELLIIHVFILFYFINFFPFFLNLDNIIIKLVNVRGTMRKEAEVNQEPDFFFFSR